MVVDRFCTSDLAGGLLARILDFLLAAVDTKGLTERLVLFKVGPERREGAAKAVPFRAAAQS